MPPARRSTRTTNPAIAAPTTSRRSRRAHPYDRDEGTAADSSFSSASIARDDVNGRTNLRLTVKAPPSKLRQATSGPSAVGLPAHSYDSDSEEDGDEEDEAIDIEDDLDDDGPQRSKRGAPTRRMAPSVSDSDATPAPAARTKRSTRNPRTVIEMDSDDDLDEDAPGEEEDEEEDAEGDEDDEMQDDSEQDAEGEEDDEMEDVQLNRHPPPPVIRTEPRSATKGKAAGKGGAKANGKTQVTVKVSAPPTKAPLKSVEKKQMDLDMDGDDDDDDELSELESGDEDENELGDDDEDEDKEEEDEDDDDDDSDADGSRAGTPDLTKLTKRQRGAYEEASEFGLLALSNEAQKKKHLTAEEHAVRRAEMARRRKNLSEKRNEEEKMDTIAKLLSKPAPKRRSRAEMLAVAQAAANSGDISTPGADEEEDGVPRRRPADPVFTRWVQNREGAQLAFPKEWLEGPLADRWAVQEVASNVISSDEKAAAPAAVENTVTKRPHVGITLLEEIV